MSEPQEKKDWFKTWWGICLVVIFWFVLVPYVIWTKTSWSKEKKIGAIAIILIVFIIVGQMGQADKAKLENETKQQKVSLNATQTVLALTPSVTPKPKDTELPTETPAPTKDVKKEAKIIDYKLIKKNPDKYKGEIVKFSGKVFRVEADKDGEVLQMWVNGGSDNLIVYNPNESEIVEDNQITVYGLFLGTTEGTNAFGATITTPMMMASEIVKK